MKNELKRRNKILNTDEAPQLQSIVYFCFKRRKTFNSWLDDDFLCRLFRSIGPWTESLTQSFTWITSKSWLISSEVTLIFFIKRTRASGNFLSNFGSAQEFLRLDKTCLFRLSFLIVCLFKAEDEISILKNGGPSKNTLSQPSSSFHAPTETIWSKGIKGKT